MASPIIKYFNSEHPKLELQAISQVARLLDERLPDGPEKSAGMRKLLEARDCFVRASLDA